MKKLPNFDCFSWRLLALALALGQPGTAAHADVYFRIGQSGLQKVLEEEFAARINGSIPPELSWLHVEKQNHDFLVCGNANRLDVTVPKSTPTAGPVTSASTPGAAASVQAVRLPQPAGTSLSYETTEKGIRLRFVPSEVDLNIHELNAKIEKMTVQQGDNTITLNNKTARVRDLRIHGNDPAHPPVEISFELVKGADGLFTLASSDVKVNPASLTLEKGALEVNGRLPGLSGAEWDTAVADLAWRQVLANREMIARRYVEEKKAELQSQVQALVTEKLNPPLLQAYNQSVSEEIQLMLRQIEFVQNGVNGALYSPENCFALYPGPSSVEEVTTARDLALLLPPDELNHRIREQLQKGTSFELKRGRFQLEDLSYVFPKDGRYYLDVKGTYETDEIQARTGVRVTSAQTTAHLEVVPKIENGQIKLYLYEAPGAEFAAQVPLNGRPSEGIGARYQVTGRTPDGRSTGRVTLDDGTEWVIGRAFFETGFVKLDRPDGTEETLTGQQYLERKIGSKMNKQVYVVRPPSMRARADGTFAVSLELELQVKDFKDAEMIGKSFEVWQPTDLDQVERDNARSRLQSLYMQRALDESGYDPDSRSRSGLSKYYQKIKDIPAAGPVTDEEKRLHAIATRAPNPRLSNKPGEGRWVPKTTFNVQMDLRMQPVWRNGRWEFVYQKVASATLTGLGENTKQRRTPGFKTSLDRNHAWLTDGILGKGLNSTLLAENAKIAGTIDQEIRGTTKGAIVLFDVDPNDPPIRKTILEGQELVREYMGRDSDISRMGIDGNGQIYVDLAMTAAPPGTQTPAIPPIDIQGKFNDAIRSRLPSGLQWHPDTLGIDADGSLRVEGDFSK
ncbi:MAG: hypothetical protein AB7P04_11810 [Bacteriovoracia bacterium]